MLAGGGEVVAHLNAQFPRRYHDEGLWCCGARTIGCGYRVEPREQRDAEAEGLARSGLRLADDVVSLEASGRVNSWMRNAEVMPISARISGWFGDTEVGEREVAVRRMSP